MKNLSGGILAAAIAASLIAMPASACWSDVEQEAATIANLNQKLMVSRLRCRFDKDNFLNDYNRFVTRNNMLLAGQHAIIKARYARVNGAGAADSELDKFMIGLANHYGGGRGDPDCHQLKQAAELLSSSRLDHRTLGNFAGDYAGVPRQAANSCSVSIASRR